MIKHTFLMLLIFINQNLVAMAPADRNRSALTKRLVEGATIGSLTAITAVSAYRASQIHENTLCMYKEKDSDYLFSHSGVLFRTLGYTFLSVTSTSIVFIYGMLVCDCCQRNGMNIDQDASDDSDDSDNGDDDDDRLPIGHKHQTKF